MASVSVTRAGAILAVADVERSSAWYSRHLGFSVDATYDDPPYAILSLHGTRLSLAEQGHPAEDRPGVTMVAPEDRSRLQVALVLEVEDCRGAYESLRAEGVMDSPHAEAFEFVQSLQAIPRRGESADIAPTVAFLCSEEAAWVTGQMIAVDGGHTRH